MTVRAFTTDNLKLPNSRTTANPEGRHGGAAPTNLQLSTVNCQLSTIN
ncbi:MAG: hypothetical protein HC849_25940 [Oscillatoriales cyanobacterium RU_3_3]|nr:hypothetical protein [Microcoleus sp. SU_5_6]NJL69137.1 hypothetical protein [Microcoleus sp. SM1_3_4]NJM62853.1 hypothetical protein [Oscillatoriales cyanobacterium RU_3_3]NJR24602.1 hypothetical protein [Richelia sp. CSU_2_1]